MTVEMSVDWDVEIAVSDGSVVRADVFRPAAAGRYPALMNYGPYGKGLPFQVGYSKQWESLVSQNSEVLRGSSAKYANWETADPERWVPLGYACIRVDSRGAGRSPGVADPYSPQETEDFYDCIEWAAKQPWCNGKIGLAGISYYAANQWLVAARRPPHLAAICPFEGFSDWYRGPCRAGGILSTAPTKWYGMQVLSVQNGLGTRGLVNPNNGVSVSGPEEFDDEQLRARQVDLDALTSAELITDRYYADRSADLAAIEVPVLSCGNWGGLGVHLLGNVEGYRRAGSKQKWLELHGKEHWTEFYTDYGVDLQRRFFDYFLKGEKNGWDREPPIKLQVRHVDKFVERAEFEWPIPRTDWTFLHLDIKKLTLGSEAAASPAETSFDAMSGKVSFSTPPFDKEIEVTGPLAAKLFVSSTTRDVDIFLTIRAFAPDGKEHLVVGAVDPHSPITQGWLRASHRKLDASASTPYQPVHTHDELQPLNPGEIYELDIEIWPTSFVFPKGYRLVLTVSGSDFEHDLPGDHMRDRYNNHPKDRSNERFAGITTLHSGGTHAAHLLIPIVPKP
jgi:predicted acyl esterase